MVIIQSDRLLKKLGIVAVLFLCCVSVGCITDTDSPDMTPPQEFLEKLNETQEYYGKLVVADPNNATAWCIRGICYNNNYEQYDEAMESCNKALELNPEYGLAWYLKGVILMNTNKNDEAKLCFQNATKYDIGLTAYIPSI